jgi:hypothetical protein
MLIDFVHVSARCVGLPNFHQCVCEGATVFVQDAAAHDDPFSKRLAFVLAGKVVRGGRYQFGSE